jgi:hypothetical protein
MSEHEIEGGLHIRPRDSKELSLRLPVSVIASLQRVAERRDMSVEALIRLYIGSGLRQDLAAVWSDRVLEATADVLGRRIESTQEVSDILAEIKEDMQSLG